MIGGDGPRPLVALIPVWVGHQVDGQPAAYVWRNRTCDIPVTSGNALLERWAA